jgi:hypothetical protein
MGIAGLPCHKNIPGKESFQVALPLLQKQIF